MDRLFLAGLVTELAPALRGVHVRAVALDRVRGVLSLATSLDPPRHLLLSWNRDAPGLFRGEPPSRGEPSPGLRRWLGGSVIDALHISSVDRIVTLSLSKERLSGRRERVSLVIEALSTRAAVYLVDASSGTVLAALSSGVSRVSQGERFEPLPPPPHAAPLAADEAEFRQRLSGLWSGEGEPPKKALLEASGATPLLVEEMRWIMRARGVEADAAFGELRSRLDEGRPVLYVARGTGSGPPLVSPLLLDSVDSEPRSMPSFSDAMAEALRLVLETRRRRTAQQKVETSIARALGRIDRLEAKLTAELDALDPPDELRRRGERLFGALARARRVRDGWVAVPDVYDPEGREVEIAVDPRLGLVANAERMFSLARRSGRARTSIEKRLSELERDRSYWEELALALEDARDVEELEDLAGELDDARSDGEGRTGSPRRAGPRRYLTSSGSLVLVGRSGRGNDEVTFRSARPEDLWLHAAGMPGAHVVLKRESGAAAEEADVLEAAAVAAYYSKARQSSRVEVMVTERKHVSKIRGAPPGTVRVATYRTVRVPPKLPEGGEPA